MELKKMQKAKGGEEHEEKKRKSLHYILCNILLVSIDTYITTRYSGNK